MQRTLSKLFRLSAFIAFAAVISGGSRAQAQDWFKTETSTGVDKIRIAVADFKPLSPDQALKKTFDTVLFADLSNAGIFDIVSKSLLPMASPGAPSEMNVNQWAAAPSNASMVAFGSAAVQSGKLVVNGWLFDAKNTQYPQVLVHQYNEDATEDNARQIAHRFADEIIFRLGGGIPGIAETKIYYISARGGSKEIWAMDYDGANQHEVTHLGTISLSPRVSPDNTRIAFSSLGKDGFQVRMYSLLLNRMVAFPSSPGTNVSPAWSSTGGQLAYSSSRSGDPEIWVADANGNGSRRVTSFRGPDVSPVWNPKTNAQIAWISGRSGLPQLYIMDADGAGVTRLTDGGYATSPSWSPNGQLLTFAWNRKYGPGAPGGQDIYVMEVAPSGNTGSSYRMIQLTHDTGGRCDFPSWSPDGRHIVYASTASGKSEIWTMLADGTGKRQLTNSGGNDMPNWSWK